VRLKIVIPLIKEVVLVGEIDEVHVACIEWDVAEKCCAEVGLSIFSTHQESWHGLLLRVLSLPWKLRDLQQPSLPDPSFQVPLQLFRLQLFVQP